MDLRERILLVLIILLGVFLTRLSFTESLDQEATLPSGMFRQYDIAFFIRLRVDWTRLI